MSTTLPYGIEKNRTSTVLTRIYDTKLNVEGLASSWEVIENGNSWVPIPVTTPSETGTSTATKMTVPSTSEEKTLCKKNDSMFVHIKAQFAGNERIKRRRTHKALLKQQYENFSDSSLESLDSIFNRLQKLVRASSTNNINFVNPEVSTATTKVKTASTSFDDMEEMDLKVGNMALLSMGAKKFYQQIWIRKIICWSEYLSSILIIKSKMVLDLIGEVTWQRKKFWPNRASWTFLDYEVLKEVKCLRTRLKE
ncbi:hypothetical protein Tco_0959829 [Tanacetum coccineum]